MSVYANQRSSALVRPVVLAITGNVRQPSRTRALVDVIVETAEQNFEVQAETLDIAEVGPSILSALTRPDLSPEGEAMVERIEAADLLIIGTPVYRASYSGALKHLFDLVRYDALTGKIAILAATGGTPLHGLILEHQLRPLCGYFNVTATPTAIYALESDFAEYRLNNSAIEMRIARAVADAQRLVASILLPHPELARA